MYERGRISPKHQEELEKEEQFNRRLMRVTGAFLFIVVVYTGADLTLGWPLRNFLDSIVDPIAKITKKIENPSFENSVTEQSGIDKVPVEH